MDNMHMVKETTLTVEKNCYALVFPNLGSVSFQTRAKLKKYLKCILNCCNLQIVFKNKTRLGNNVHFKYWISKNLASCVAYKFQCGFFNEPYYG